MKASRPTHPRNASASLPSATRDEWLSPRAFWIAAFVLMVCVIAIYSPTLNFQFVLDEHRFVSVGSVHSLVAYIAGVELECVEPRGFPSRTLYLPAYSRTDDRACDRISSDQKGPCNVSDDDRISWDHIRCADREARRAVEGRFDRLHCRS